MTLKHLVILGTVGLVLASAGALAQEAPPPHRMPRTPVSRETLAGNKSPLPPSRTLTGSVTIIDTERLRLGDVEMRLFGIVPPHLSASFGPQARAVLDTLVTAGATSCTIRDRDRDGRFLATCHSAGGADLALELLRRGLAVTARGSLQPTDLATPYQAAEQAAQAGRLGLWSVTLPQAVSDAAIRETAARTEAARTAASAPAPQEAALKAKEDAARSEVRIETKTESKGEPIIIPTTVLKTDKTEKAEKPAAAPKAESASPMLLPLDESWPVQPVVEATGFFERYQLLLTGLLMFITALGIAAVVVGQRWLDRREEVRSIAAALRGELMAARAVCQARLLAVTAETDEKNISWPRIRALVFQAYVGRLGLLGAMLARQIASIYGQASDYAAYYGTAPVVGTEPKIEPVSKRQALQTLAQHIEEVLPQLAYIEQSGAMGIRFHISAKPFFIPSQRSPQPGATMSPGVENALREAKALAAMPAKSETGAEEKAPGITGAGMPHGNMTTGAPASPPVPLWNAIRKFATDQLDRGRKDPMADHIPDYTAMAEDEEMETFTYDGNLDHHEAEPHVPAGKVRNTG